MTVRELVVEWMMMKRNWTDDTAPYVVFETTQGTEGYRGAEEGPGTRLLQGQGLALGGFPERPPQGRRSARYQRGQEVPRTGQTG